MVRRRRTQPDFEEYDVYGDQDYPGRGRRNNRGRPGESTKVGRAILGVTFAYLLLVGIPLIAITGGAVIVAIVAVNAVVDAAEVEDKPSKEMIAVNLEMDQLGSVQDREKVLSSVSKLHNAYLSGQISLNSLESKLKSLRESPAYSLLLIDDALSKSLPNSKMDQSEIDGVKRSFQQFAWGILNDSIHSTELKPVLAFTVKSKRLKSKSRHRSFVCRVAEGHINPRYIKLICLRMNDAAKEIQGDKKIDLTVEVDRLVNKALIH